MADKIKYPIHLYNVRGEFRCCDNDAQRETARQDGFTQSYVRSDYPKRLYAKDGSSIVVYTAADDKARKAEGYGEGVIAAAPAKPATAPATEGASETLRLLFAEISDLRNRVDALEDALTLEKASMQAKVPAKA